MRTSLAWRLAPTLIALGLGIAYLVAEPRPGDLAAHEFRADLFGREGFAIWNGDWYGGHHTLAYSVLSPPLAWLVGPRVVLVLAAVASAALFEELVRDHLGPRRARAGAVWLGIATGSLLATSRMPFALGVALGLGALLALQRGRSSLAAAAAVLCPLASRSPGSSSRSRASRTRSRSRTGGGQGQRLRWPPSCRLFSSR